MAKWQQQQESPSTQLSLNDRTAEAGKELLEIIKSKSLLNQVPYSRFSSWHPALWMDLGFECSCCASWVPHFNTAEEEHLAAMQQAAPSLSHLLQRRCQLLLTHHSTETGGKIQEKYLTFSLLKQVMQPAFTWTFPFHTRRTSVMQQLRTTRSNTSPETGIFHKTSQLVIFELSFAWGWLFSAHYRCLFYSFSGTRTAFSLCSAQDAPWVQNLPGECAKTPSSAASKWPL